MVYGTLKFYPVCSGGILLGDKDDHSPSGTYVKNAGSYASTSTRLYGTMYRKPQGNLEFLLLPLTITCTKNTGQLL